MQTASEVTRKRRRRTPLALLMTLGLLASILMIPASASEGDPGPQLDASVAPQFRSGNVTCAGFQDPQGADTVEYKIEPVSSGTYDIDGFVVDITAYNYNDGTWRGQVFDFEITSGHLAYTVVVKGGPDANLYDYRPAGVSADETLHAPVNRDNRFYGLSHISFCADEDPRVEPEGTVVVDKTVNTSFARTHDWSIEKEVDPLGIKLWIPGQGDDKPDSGTARWDIDVTYEGFDDDDITVFGTITISVSGDADARITGVTDVITQGATNTNATVECEEALPYTLSPGEELDCTYSAIVATNAGGTNVATAVGTLLFEDLDPEIYLPKDNLPFDADSEPETVAFGDPDPEHHKVVNVEDLSDLTDLGVDGFQDFGTLDADDFDEGEVQNFWYDKEFDWTDYATNSDDQEGCTIPGEFHQYDNTASVIGDDDEVLDSADADLKVKVQCWVPDPDFNGGDPADWGNDNED